MQTLFASIFVFGLLIFAHEFGHYIAAKTSGIHVIEFAVGFGPRIFGWEKKGTKYSLRLFPLGGFCRMLGEASDEIEAKGSFQKQPLFRRFVVIVAGPLMNFLLAILLFSLIYFIFLGVPLVHLSTIGNVRTGGRAEEAGIRDGDKVTVINDIIVEDWGDVVALINAHPDEEIEITLNREGVTKTFSVVPEADPNTGRGLIGIAPLMQKYNFFASLRSGFQHFWWFLRFISASIFQMVTGQIPADVAGPVGIIYAVGEVAEAGFGNLLSLAAIISINLGIINLLPIPALDGSRLIFLFIEALRGKPIDPQKESLIHFVGFTILILLMVFITYHDLYDLL